MCDAGIDHRLLLEEEIYMVLLQREGEAEALDRERDLLGIIVEPQQVELADDGLDAALQLAHATLVAGEVLNDMGDNLLAEANLLEEVDFTERLGHEVLLRNNELLLEVEAGNLDVVHTVAQNGVDAFVVVVAEDEQATAQIEVDAGKVLVLEAVILAAVRKMDEQIVDLLALRRLADLVELIEVDDGVHALGLDEHIDDAPPCGALIRVAVPIEERCIRCTAERDEVERATQCLGDTVLDQRRLANTGRAMDTEHITRRLWVRDPLTHELHDLQLSLVVPVDCGLHVLVHR